MSVVSNTKLLLEGNSRHKELQAAIMHWALRGMSKSQCRQMTRWLDEQVSSRPLGDAEFREVFKAGWQEVSQLEQEEDFKDLSEFETLPVEWLLKPLIPVGVTSMLDGNPGVGKSFLTLELTAAVTKTGQFNGQPVARKGRVLLLNDEDDPSRVLRPRLEAAGADIDKIRVVENAFPLDDEGVEKVRREIRDYGPTLVGIDPVTNFMPSSVDMYRPNEANAFMRPLHRLAKEFDIAIVIARHLRKQSSDTAMHMGQGSMAFAGAVRSGMIVTKHPTEPQWRVLAHYKNSYAREAASQAFEICEPSKGGAARIKWRGTVEMSADELGMQSFAKESVLDRTARALEDFLASGPAKAKAVYEAMKKKGFSERTVERAKKKLRVISDKGRGSKWRLPD